MSDLPPALGAKLLGPPHFVWQDVAVSPGPRKVSALLICLSLRREGLTRSELAELLWGVGKLNNLRQALHALRRLPGAELWLHDGDHLRLSVRSDLDSFETAIHNGRYQQALSLWQGPLLDRLEVPDATAFMDMVELERSRVRALYLDALESRAFELERAGQHEAALGVVDELLRHDNLSETAHRAAMRLEHRVGNLGGALARFEVCRRVLHEELGVEPLEETRALLKEIEAGLSLLRDSEKARLSERRAVLPASQSTFVGRRTELSAARRLLESQECRLLSLIGPGGAGKTRLALEVAAGKVDAFPEGVYFVPLAPVSAGRLIPTAIANALGFTFTGDQAVERQLASYLREKRTLLVIDNLEHLPDGADLLIDLLEACPRLSLLVTSREPLGINQETRIEIEGLACPLLDDERPERFDAVRLFRERARQAEPGFKVDSGNRAAVAKIARLLDGLPLGIELAAALVGRLTPGEIAADLEANLDAIGRDSPEIPVRHRSLRSVFEHSWRLLSDPEREALAKLSVFRGGCGREAAQLVSDATLRTLLALVDKSLLRRAATGRFELLEAVRQYAAEQLANDRAARDAHCSYFTHFLEVLKDELTGAGQTRALAEVSLELDNVRAAWHWAAERRRTDDIDRSVETLSRYYDIKALNAEALELFNTAAEALRAGADKAAGITLVRLLLRQGVFMNRLARFDEARQLLAEGLSRLDDEEPGDPREEAFAHGALGAVAYKQGDFQLSGTHFERALTLYQRESDDRGVAMALDGLGSAAFARGDHTEAERRYRQSLEVASKKEDHYWMLRGYKNVGMVSAVQGKYPQAQEMLERAVAGSRAAGDRSVLAGALNNLGRVQQILGDLEASETSLRECLELHSDAGNTWGAALVSSNLGTLRYERKDFEGARTLHREALASFEQIGNQSGMALALARLGAIALEEGDDRAASTYFIRGLKLAEAMGEIASVLDLALGHAVISVHEGDLAGATALISMIATHRSSEPQTVRTAQDHLAGLRRRLQPDAFADATAQGEALELRDVVRELLAKPAR